MVRQCFACRKIDNRNLDVSFHKDRRAGLLTQNKDNFTNNGSHEETFSSQEICTTSSGSAQIDIQDVKMLPTDVETRNIWLSLIGAKKGQQIPKCPFLCSDHFDPEDIVVRANEFKYIKSGATPKICDSLLQASSRAERGIEKTFNCIVEECLNKRHINKLPFVKYIPISQDNNQWIKWIDKLASELGIQRDIMLAHWKCCPQICSLHFDEKDFVTDSEGLFLITDRAMPSANLSGNAKIIQSKSLSDTLTVGLFKKAVVGDGSITILPSVKDSQLNALKYIYDIDLDSEKKSVKTSAKLNVDEEKNRLLIKGIKSKNEGICRLCLHVFKKSRLTLFSTKMKPSEDKTIQDCLIEILPSISDSIKTHNEICDICHKHLLITKEFFKMTSNVQNVLKTVLKNQLFIFNEGNEEEFIKQEIDDTNDMQLEKITNQDTTETMLISLKQEVNDDIDSQAMEQLLEEINNQDIGLREGTTENLQASPKQEVNEDIDLPFNDNFNDLSLSVPADGIISNMFDNLQEQQNNVLSKLILERFRPENQSKINSVQLEQGTIKYEVVVEDQTISESSSEMNYQENDPLPSQKTDMQYNTLVNSGSTDYPLTESPPSAESMIASNSDSNDPSDCNEVSRSDTQRNLKRPTSTKTPIVNKRSNQYIIPIATPKPNISHRKKLEECLLQELGRIENLTHNQRFLAVSPISNANNMVETLLDSELNVVLADFNIAAQKRVVFVGEVICVGCQQPKTHCQCSANGGMCHKCGKILNEYYRLQQHINNCCYTRCQKCNKRFYFKTSYNQHIDNTGDAPECKILKCKICKLLFTKEGFKTHSLEHPNKLCDKCGRSLSVNQNRCPCIGRPKRIKQICNVCGRAVNYLSEHMKTHMAAVNCPICNKKLTQKRLELHISTYHKEREYTCDMCDSKFGDRRALTTHVRVVHLRVPVATCTICNINFARKDYYRAHYRNVHRLNLVQRSNKGRRSLGERVTCKICKKTLLRGRIRRHALLHFRSRFKCSICPKTFHNFSNQMRHEKLHKNPNYKFGCRICHKFNKSEEELQKHMKKSHSKDPKVLYQCYHCNEKFKRKFLLRVHLDGHEKERILDYYPEIFEEPKASSTDKDAPPTLAEES